jgi:hypothetical protein
MRRVLITVVLLVCAGVVRAQGEQCLTNVNPCEAYAEADAVFIAKVTRVVQPSLQIWQRDKDYDQVAYVTVEKMFKGVPRKTMVLHQLGRKIAPKFLSGTSYVFYANLDPVTKKWEVRRCGRTRMSKYANDDLRYFEGLPATLNQTRIAGEVTRYETDEDNPQGRTERLPGIRIHIKGEGKEYEVVTDARGVYELTGVPAGKYVIEPDLPAGLTLMLVIRYGPFDRTKVKSLNIELKERGCSGLDIILTSGPPSKQTIGEHE